jgi:hypothetical protein
MDKYVPLDKVYELVADANSMLFQVWKAQILFSWRWWFEIVLTLIPWILWIKYRDKTQTIRLLFVGLLVGLITNTLDVIGGCFNLWHYDWKMLPFIPVYIPWDFALFPVIVMFLLQVKPKIKVIYKALGFAAYSAFISEPLFHWLGLYHPIKWKSWYSFIIYIFLYLFFNFVYNSKPLKQCNC